MPGASDRTPLRSELPVFNRVRTVGGGDHEKWALPEDRSLGLDSRCIAFSTGGLVDPDRAVAQGDIEVQDSSRSFAWENQR